MVAEDDGSTAVIRHFDVMVHFSASAWAEKTWDVV
jgi:hypothetical protein